ncbi:vasculin-like protein 1 isoform X1 [Gadus morhua]|uniref:vasculin-like protein 1 isoform X1 n=1 Tax=Gadus morhua TaxID=8049 RepID=UPI0011B4E453|nr:vasculin-like protein 1 isoform X1 [Gadus morhua]XP_030218738.1 vasculin-like protein 1 isoform X1 [Gadus morhua]XP_030218739.1 vasculin-like protein 1 isoform X1 [Gadus morhua]
MAQHDFVPAWLNFSTPQPAKSSSHEPQGEPQQRGGRGPASRRRHNSSDGFFNNGPLRAPAGDGWQPPSLLLRHDSVDSGVAKGGHGGLAGGSCWKEAPGWHGAPRGGQDAHHPPGRHPKRVGGERDRQGGHRQRNGNFHPRKGAAFQDKFPGEERKEDKLKFVEEDFPSLNPETTGKPGPQVRAPAPRAGVWENPPSGKQMVSKMLVIKKVSKEDPSTAFLAGFAVAGALSTNGSKSPMLGSSVYKNLLPKPVAAPTKTQWKAGGREGNKPGPHLGGREALFTSPVSAPKAPPSTAPHSTPKEQQPSSTTPPIDIVPSRLKLMRRGPDRKSEFLRALKDEGPGDTTTSSSSPGTSGEGDGGTPEPKADSEEGAAHENGLAYSLSDSDTEHLSSSLEAEHRLLKSMGWQECPENDDNFLPLTEDELREFQTKTEQLKRGGLQRNGVLPRPRGVTLHFTPWRSEPHVDEEDEDEGSETSSSSQTSDDEGGVRP